MLTLWDLIEPFVRPGHTRRVARRRIVQSPAPAPTIVAPRARARAVRPSMQERYDRITRHMLDTHNIRVRKWRTSMSGIAWYVKYKDGRIQRLIESPRPKGPMSAAVFLHEIGHHAIGFNTFRPRCLEEYHAWRWSLEQMEALGLNITDGVLLRMHRSLWYAVEKAKRRGIKEIPVELTPYLIKPANRSNIYPPP